jgi:poly(A) polymerase
MVPNNIHLANLAKNLPPEVKKIFNIFLNQGDEIRLVGGCVRDLLIEKQVNDFDFATKFLPEEIIKILEKNKIQAILTGVKFGTITAVVNHKNFEITTLRKDFETDGRHCQPEFIDDYFLDAARRDFTINALYLDDKGLVHDYFNGISDLKNQEVKFIGNAQERIEEDFLRILRFFRFSCDYAKQLDEVGLKACFVKKDGLQKLSRERIRMEFLKLISSPKKAALIEILKQAEEQKILSEIFSMKLDIKALETLFQIEDKLQISADLNLKMAALFLTEILRSCHSALPRHSREGGNPLLTQNWIPAFAGMTRGAGMTKEGGMTTEIVATNSEKQHFQFLLKNISNNFDGKNLKLLLAFENKDLVRNAYLFSLLKNFNEAEAKKNLNCIENFSMPNFLITGEDVKALGIKDKNIGIALKEAKEFWVLNGFEPKKEELLKRIKKD